MGNMSHCRFQNTVQDMDDCIETIYDMSDMSDDEKTARLEFIEKCIDIALDYGDEVGRSIIEE